MARKNALIRAIALLLPTVASGCQSSFRPQSPRPSLVDKFLFQPDRYPVGEWKLVGSSNRETSGSDRRAAGVSNGWFAEAKNPRAVVLYTEGNAGNITESPMGPRPLPRPLECFGAHLRL